MIIEVGGNERVDVTVVCVPTECYPRPSPIKNLPRGQTVRLTVRDELYDIVRWYKHGALHYFDAWCLSNGEIVTIISPKIL